LKDETWTAPFETQAPPAPQGEGSNRTTALFDNLSERLGGILDRLTGRGALTEKDVFELGCVGPMARASGVPIDMRKNGYAAYSHIKWNVITEKSGDCYARTNVRIGEVYESIKIIQQAISLMPSGDIDVKIVGNPDGEYFQRIEQPRGEVIYYVKGNGTKNLDRMRVRTPTFANIPALLHTLKGVQLADVPVLVLTIDPCISCTER